MPGDGVTRGLGLSQVLELTRTVKGDFKLSR